MLLLQRTLLAMTRVGIPPEDQEAIMQAVAAILHLGNINFKSGPDESSLPADAKAEHHLAVTGVRMTTLNCQLSYLLNL
jgi:myosin heavy subunit